MPLDLVTRLPPPAPARVPRLSRAVIFVSNFHSDRASSAIQTSADVLHSPPVLALPEFLIKLHSNRIPLASTLGHYDPDNPAEYSTLCLKPGKPPGVSSKYTLHHNCNTWHYHTSTLRSYCPQLLDRPPRPRDPRHAQLLNIDHQPTP